MCWNLNSFDNIFWHFLKDISFVAHSLFKPIFWIKSSKYVIWSVEKIECMENINCAFDSPYLSISMPFIWFRAIEMLLFLNYDEIECLKKLAIDDFWKRNRLSYRKMLVVSIFLFSMGIAKLKINEMFLS